MQKHEISFRVCSARARQGRWVLAPACAALILLATGASDARAQCEAGNHEYPLFEGGQVESHAMIVTPASTAMIVAHT